MAPMPSLKSQGLSETLKNQLLDIARLSIHQGLTQHKALKINSKDYPEALQVKRACFVTLTKDNALRGCIGRLEAQHPLVIDVAENAYAAAFKDPRFPDLRTDEFNKLDLHISILTIPEEMTFSSEADLIKQLQPRIDGLILEDGAAKGTFLPAVWESLPEAIDFLTHLKQKAGLKADYWSNTLKIYRYQTESFP